MSINAFIYVLISYLYEIVPALAIGFLISGVVHELIPEDKVLKYLGSGGIAPVFYSTLIGALLPVCCWGSLPIAVSFYKKGAKLGPILAFLVATPATSISALLVAYSILGLRFAFYIFFAVIAMGITIGLIGNRIKYKPKEMREEISCPHCQLDPEHVHNHRKKTLKEKIIDALKYAYIDMPKEIGGELFFGLILAALVSTFLPIGKFIKSFFSGWLGYVFAVIVGIFMYLCSTASVPLIDSLIRRGFNQGAGMTLLLIGPIVSYGTVLVVRKEFGSKVLAIFLLLLIVLSLLTGFGYQMLCEL